VLLTTMGAQGSTCGGESSGEEERRRRGGEEEKRRRGEEAKTAVPDEETTCGDHISDSLLSEPVVRTRMAGAAGCDCGAQALAEQEKFDLRAAVAESLTPLRAAGAKVDLGAFASPIDVDSDDPGDPEQTARRLLERQERGDLRRALEESHREAVRQGIVSSTAGADADLQAASSRDALQQRCRARATLSSVLLLRTAMMTTHFSGRCVKANGCRRRNCSGRSLRVQRTRMPEIIPA